MAKITEDDIMNTLTKFIVAGKSIPKEFDSFGATSEERFKVMVSVWYDVFKDKGQERWTAAEKIALLATGPNTNTINTGLMAAALDQAEKQYLQEQRSKAAEHKDIKINIPNGTYEQKCSRYLMEWTINRLNKRPLIMETMPSNQEVYDFAYKHNVQVIEPQEGRESRAGINFVLLQTYLSDKKVCTEYCNPLRCLLRKRQPRMFINDQDINFQFKECEK